MYVKKWNIKRAQWIVAIVLSGLMMIVSFQNCSAVRSANGDAKTSRSLSEQDLLGKQAMEVLSAKCLTCHNPDKPEGGISDITDLGSLLYYRLVIPGQPEISDVIRVIKDGSMPPNGGVSLNELAALNTWIMEGLIDDAGSVTLPAESAALEPTYSSIKIRIINTKCLTCHGNNGVVQGGVNLTTYAGTVANNIARANDPNGSRLVQAITRPGNDFMPRNGARLNADEIAAIRTWIQNGALQ
ncbi:MAG: c-type cytochrome [Bdellovibrionaceae bacterium]|nr:c-type cytochrome [Pseudobdellovibrionaceae bacterium]